MTRRDWWLGVLLVTAAILVHALVPRFEITATGGGLMRVDRWMGRVEIAAGGNVARTPWLSAPRQSDSWFVNDIIT